MQVLVNKQVLVIGEETTQVHDLEEQLKKEGAIVHKLLCEEVSEEKLVALKIDVVFINHLHENTHCTNLLSKVKNNTDTKVLPVFVLVNDNQIDIERVLDMGAADYFTSKESIQQILNKIRIVLGDPMNAASETVIDIAESEPELAKTGVKVLLVEDDPLLSNLLSIRLNKASFPFRVNKNGNGVIADIQEFDPDVVILDIMLPGQSGLTVLEEIRSHAQFGKLPVFIFSNRDSQEDKKRATELKVNGFFVKAMTDLSELISNIEKAAHTVDDNRL